MQQTCFAVTSGPLLRLQVGARGCVVSVGTRRVVRVVAALIVVVGWWHWRGGRVDVGGSVGCGDAGGAGGVSQLRFVLSARQFKQIVDVTASVIVDRELLRLWLRQRLKGCAELHAVVQASLQRAVRVVASFVVVVKWWQWRGGHVGVRSGVRIVAAFVVVVGWRRQRRGWHGWRAWR